MPPKGRLGNSRVETKYSSVLKKLPPVTESTRSPRNGISDDSSVLTPGLSMPRTVPSRKNTAVSSCSTVTWLRRRMFSSGHLKTISPLYASGRAMNSRRRSLRKPIRSDSMDAGPAPGYGLTKLSEKVRDQPRGPPHVLAIRLAEGLDQRPFFDLDPVRHPGQGQHEAGQRQPVGGA